MKVAFLPCIENVNEKKGACVVSKHLFAFLLAEGEAAALNKNTDEILCHDECKEHS